MDIAIIKRLVVTITWATRRAGNRRPDKKLYGHVTDNNHKHASRLCSVYQTISIRFGTHGFEVLFTQSTTCKHCLLWDYINQCRTQIQDLFQVKGESQLNSLKFTYKYLHAKYFPKKDLPSRESISGKKELSAIDHDPDRLALLLPQS